MAARRLLAAGAAGLGIVSVSLTGCQTTPAGFGGMTLPSPHYLEHYPQYFPPDPPFPLQRELDSMQDPEGLGRRGAAGPLPAPLPAPAIPRVEATPPAGLPAPAPAAGAPIGK
jgi:hypothetical protein